MSRARLSRRISAVSRNFSSLTRKERFSTLLYGSEEFGPEESREIQEMEQFGLNIYIQVIDFK
jgi:hypothetical protein